MQVRPQSTSRAVEEVLSQRLLAQVGYILAMCRRYSADRVRCDGDRKARLPAIYYQRGWVDESGLISSGPNYRDLFRRSAQYVDKVLKGAAIVRLQTESVA